MHGLSSSAATSLPSLRLRMTLLHSGVMSRSLHLACYDVSSELRLRNALKVARRYATGGQKSVHECWLTPQELGDLLADYSYVIDLDTDRVVLVRLDASRAVRFRRQAQAPTDNEFLMVA